MRSPTYSLLTLLFVTPCAGLVAQASRGVIVPTGARVKVETQQAAGTVEGTVLAWRGDTLVLRADERGDTMRVPGSSLKSLRVVESPALWRYATSSDITFYYVVVPPPNSVDPTAADAFQHLLLVATKTELAGVDPITGTALWTRTDLPDLQPVALDPVGRTAYGVITRGERMEIIDLRTGATRWDTQTLALLSARGWLPLPAEDTLLLMFGRTAASASTLMAVEVGTGKVRWRQDSLFAIEPKVFGTGGVSYLLGHQVPLADSDSTLILYISAEGPMRLNARTGALLWKAGVLRGAKVPAVSDAYASIRLGKGIIYVPSEKRLFALRTTDGSPAWDAPRVLKSQVIRMERTRHGLLVRGEDWLDLLDPASGKSVWPAPIELKHSTRIVLRGDTVYVAADKNVLAILMPDGSIRTLATVKFREGEAPDGFTVFPEGIVLNSWHNVMLVDRHGSEVYHRVYPSPKESFGETLRRAGVGTDTRRPTTRWGGNDLYFFTGEEDEAGRAGFSIVKFDPALGREQGRMWFDGRVPDYRIESASGTVYYKREGREILALRFVDRNALAHAARNGHVALVERLLAMGANPKAATDDGWTALHFAARGGHTEVVKLLLRSAAPVDAKTDEGWSAWMLAAAYGHADVVQSLRDAGSQYNPVAAALLHGWHLSEQGQISDALAAYREAQAGDSTLAIFPAAWQQLCWNGSLRGQAAQVMPACEQAVARTPSTDARYAAARFARGLARALTGNLEGAAADLEPSLDPEADEADGGRVQGWIDALRGGRNPFTPEVLESLRRS